jgi:hypothetical protein
MAVPGVLGRMPTANLPAKISCDGSMQQTPVLYRIAFTRLRCDSNTRRYLGRRAAQGKTRREAICCIKRYLAREIYRLLQPLYATGRDNTASELTMWGASNPTRSRGQSRSQ